jgi:hypothetical protein
MRRGELCSGLMVKCMPLSYDKVQRLDLYRVEKETGNEIASHQALDCYCRS